MSDAEQVFQDARRAWREALRDHVLAPPDAGFSGRLGALATAAAQRAAACEAAYEDGFEWPAGRGGAKPPYELQQGSGRRGPEKWWTRFDEAVAELDRVSEGRSMRAVGRAYAELSEIASQLARPLSARTARAGCFQLPGASAGGLHSCGYPNASSLRAARSARNGGYGPFVRPCPFRWPSMASGRPRLADTRSTTSTIGSESPATLNLSSARSRARRVDNEMPVWQRRQVCVSRPERDSSAPLGSRTWRGPIAWKREARQRRHWRLLLAHRDRSGRGVGTIEFVAKRSPGAGDRHDRGVAKAVASAPARPGQKRSPAPTIVDACLWATAQVSNR